MKPIALMFLLALPGLASAQTADCRTSPATTPCFFAGTALGPQRFMGQGLVSSGPPPVTAPFFEPYLPLQGSVAKETAVHRRRFHLPHFEFSAYYAIQSEHLGFQEHNSDGFKISVAHQWSDWLGYDVRGAIIQYALVKAGPYPGANGTEAIAFGPRVQHVFGRVTPYGEFLIGAVDQYEAGMTIGGAFGMKVAFTKHLYFTPFDVEYRYALLQRPSSEVEGDNPERGRVELATGGTWSF